MMKNIKFQRFMRYIVIAMVTIISSMGIFSQPVSANETESAEKPTYIVGLDDTFAPMGFRNEAGEIVGFDIDLAKEVAEINGWNLKFQPIDWALKETELNSGNIDMIWNGYGVTPEREKKVLMSETYIESGQIVVSLADSGIESLEDLEGKTISTQSGSTAMEFMQNWPNDLYNKLAKEPILYPSYNQVFADLEAGRVDAIYVGGVYGQYVMNQRGMDRYTFFTDETSIEPMAIGFRKTDTELKAQVDSAMAQLRGNGTYDEIYTEWFGAAEGSKPANENETETVEKPTYIVGLDDTFAPMGFRNEAGEIVGFDIDLAKEVAEINGWNLKFQPIDWALKETELNSGNIDMIWNGYGVTPEREKKVLMSEHYIESGQIVVSLADSGIEALEDLEGKTISTQSGSTAMEFMQNWPNDLYNKLAKEPVLYPSYNQVFADLEAGRVDAIYVGGVYGQYVMNQRGMDRYTFFTDETSVEPMAVGFRKSDTELKAQVDSAMAQLREDGTYDEIYAEWFGSVEESESEESLLIRILPALMDGLKLTLFLFVIVLLASIPLGFIIAIARVFGPQWLQMIIEAYVFVMRGTPLMLQLMVVFFGLPFIGISLDRLPAALIAFIVNYAAYFTEIFRGGISSVPKGQYESISVLGIGRLRGFRRIILPQVTKIVMPSVGNEVVALIKDTSLVYVIGLGELLRAGSIASNTYATLMPYLAVAAVYLILTGILTVGLKQVEKRMNW